MEEYKSLGHMSKIENETEAPNYYFPYHAVYKDDSITTKIRIVFNGSAKSSSGYSLNDLQFIGPAIQNDIMCQRCILIHPSDRKFQQIVWRNAPDSNLDVFQINTVTYGTASAPYLALRCIKELSKLNSRSFHLLERYTSVDSLFLVYLMHLEREKTYRDDCISGFKTEQEAIERCKEISVIMTSAGFKLRKWRSNSAYILSNLSDTKDPLSTLKFEDQDIKTLGIQWSCESD
ncbi:hypothetical protein NQ317_011245, partial [Molorchus minor]